MATRSSSSATAAKTASASQQTPGEAPQPSTFFDPANFLANSQTAAQAAALQSLANALTLTLHNAVAEQQHGHILRMSLTTAASRAILNGQTAEAEEILKLASSQLVSPDLNGVMEQIRSFLDTIGKQLQPDAAASSVSTGEEAVPAA